MPPNPLPSGSASLSDLLSTAKNLVQAINTAFTNYQNVQGQQSLSAIDGATLLKTGPGRIATVSVTTAGSTAGVIYDSNATGVTSKPIYAIPEATGVVFVNMPVTTGIVVIPGTDQVVAVSYS